MAETAEVLTQGGSLAMRAAEDMLCSRVFKVSDSQDHYVEYTDAKTDHPIGVTVAAITEDELLNQTGARAEMFLKACVVKVQLAFDHTCGTLLQPAASGVIAEYTDGNIIGVTLEDGLANDYSECLFFACH